MNDENKYYEDLISKVKQYIDENCHGSLRVADVADEFDMDERMLREYFKYIIGVSPKKYICTRVFERFMILIRENGSDNHIDGFYFARKLGFNSSVSFYNFVKNRTGMTYIDFLKKSTLECT